MNYWLCFHRNMKQFGHTMLTLSSTIPQTSSLFLLRGRPKFNSNQYFIEHLLWAKHCATANIKVNDIDQVLYPHEVPV